MAKSKKQTKRPPKRGSLKEPDMAVEIKLRAERIARDEEDTGYTNKETGKPYKRKDLTLPPLNPEGQELLMKMSEGIPFPGMCRLLRLPLYAASILNDIKEKALSLEERRRLLFAFTVECQEAMRCVSEFAKSCRNNDAQSRNDFIERYRSWEHKLLQAFERAWQELSSGKISNAGIGNLMREQVVLHRKVIMMATIEAEHNSSGEFVTRLISVKADPAKKPAGTGPEIKAVKEPQKQDEPKGKSKYTPEKIKNMQVSFHKHLEEKNDVKYAWNCVAEEHGIKSGKAAEMAVLRHQKKNK